MFQKELNGFRSNVSMRKQAGRLERLTKPSGFVPKKLGSLEQNSLFPDIEPPPPSHQSPRGEKGLAELDPIKALSAKANASLKRQTASRSENAGTASLKSAKDGPVVDLREWTDKSEPKGGAKKSQFRPPTDKSAVGSHYNEHEFNNIFKIINYLDNEEDINNRRKEFRKQLRIMKERARDDAPVHDDDEETCLSRYEVGDVLGEGSYAVVKLATLRDNPSKRFAVKIYKKMRLQDKSRLKSMELEVHILFNIDHRNIVKLYDKIEGARNVFLVMEFVSTTSLQDHLDLQPARSLSETRAARVFAQLVSAVAYLHTRNIVHRDLKLQNILIDKNMVVKLIDFGFAVQVDEETPLRVYCGTPSYMAPEIVSRTPYSGKCSDIWALGCVLFKMVAGVFPFRGTSEEELFAAITTGSFELKTQASPGLRHLLRRLLCVDPAKRIIAEEVAIHPWFADALSKDIQSTCHDADPF